MTKRSDQSAASLPHDFFSHQNAWRSALVGMRDAAPERTEDTDERAYWNHELRAFDRAYAELAAARRNPGAHNAPQDLETRLEAAFIRAGGIPGLAAAEGGARRIIEIALKEVSAFMATSSREPTAWLPLSGTRDITTDRREVDRLAENGSAVLPLFISPETPTVVPEALENSNSLLTAILLEKRPDQEIEDQISENRKALTALGMPKEPNEEPEAPHP
jgi:hypothetical protein